MPSVARNGAPVRLSYDDLPHADPTRRRIEGQGFRWGIAAPVIAEGRLWGAILAARTQGDDFAPGDEERLGHFASLVGLAIANASDRERLDRRVREHEAFGRLAAMIARLSPARRFFAGSPRRSAACSVSRSERSVATRAMPRSSKRAGPRT